MKLKKYISWHKVNQLILFHIQMILFFQSYKPLFLIGKFSVVSAKRVFNALKVVRDLNAQLKILLLIYNPL